MANPLDQVTDGLWAMLEANTAFTALVSVGNRIKYDTRRPEKRTAQFADYPQVQIVESAATHSTIHSSNTTSFLKIYRVLLATGQQDYTLFHAVEWEILRSFANWETYFDLLKWDVDNSSFVKECKLLEASQTLDNPEANRGIRGWSTIWACSVLFAFQTTAMQP